LRMVCGVSMRVSKQVSQRYQFEMIPFVKITFLWDMTIENRQVRAFVTNPLSVSSAQKNDGGSRFHR